MFEPFIWMFKTKDFFKRYLQLIIVTLSFIIFAVLSFLIGAYVPLPNQVKAGFFILAGILPVLLTLLIQGYFWELTAKIISRDVDIAASNIYSGKVKSIFIIELPEFQPFKYMWRGFASVIASILMFVPFILLVISSTYTQIFFLPYDNIEFYHRLYAISYNIIYFLFFALIPAMLWNYAKQNSIVAVWNLNKAIYLLETYPFRYIWNTILFILFYILNYYLLAGFAVVNGIQQFLMKMQSVNLLNPTATCMGVFLFLLVIYIIYL